MRLTVALLLSALALPGVAQTLPPVAAPAAPPAAAPVAGAENVPAGRPDSFAPLARRLLPAVVNISSVIGGAAPARPNQRPEAPDTPQAPPGSPFEEFFRDFFNRNRPPGGQQEGQPQQRPRGQSMGSGFVIDPSGIIVTNNHVIENATEVNVILQDNTTLRAEVLGTDPRTDLAVLRVRPAAPLPSVPWGDSDAAQVGDWVLAIGNPFGLGGTVTAGIVSARGRDIRQGPFDDFIQTDAAINRGNSGGPLFNMRGEVVGINTAIYSPTGGSIGIGFSIPSNLARGITAQLADGGRVRRGWLGVNIQQVTDEIAESLGLQGGARGALVARVENGTPAAEGGIRSGDVVLRFNSQEVRDIRALPRLVAESAVGARVPVVVWRDGREVTVQVTLGELPTEPRLAAATPNVPQPGRPTEIAGIGMRVTAITPEVRERLRLRPEQRGVAVVDVLPNSPASEREIRAGDVIVEVQQERVNTPQELAQRVEQLRRQGRGTALFLVESANGQRFVPLRLAAAPAR